MATVAPGGSARLASLRQANQARARGTRMAISSLTSIDGVRDAPAERFEQVPVALDQDSMIIAVVEMSQAGRR